MCSLKQGSTSVHGPQARFYFCPWSLTIIAHDSAAITSGSGPLPAITSGFGPLPAITSFLRFITQPRRSRIYAIVRLWSVLVKIGIGRSSSLFDPLWCDMSDRQFHLTSPLQDSGTQISSFEDSSTSPIMANAGENADANANANEADVGVGEEATDVVIEVIEEESNPFKRKERKKTSAVWNDFEPVTFADGTKKHQCKFCKDYFNIQASGSTTHLIRHLKTCVQRRLQLGLSEKREAASHMILYHEYPFMHMEHVLFNKFMKTATPHWQKINRAVAKNDCTSTYQAQKKKLKTSLKQVGRVSITTDLWKSPGQRIQYMVVTGHYVDEDWKLQKRVLSFCNVPPPHTGVIISDALYKCLVDWNIENKVATITVDNASYNDVALRNLKSTFQLLKKKLPLDGKLFHVRCCAHILNIMVQDGLSEIKWITDCIRDGVKYLIHSEARLTQFSDIAKQLKLPSKKLILDCLTRWNSTYMMLSAALEFKDVFPRYSERDVGFSYVPTYEEWERVENVCQFLEIFNDVTNIISGCEYPTSNLFLTEVWRVKEILDKNSVSELEYLRTMALKMKGKFDKYWGECNLVMALGAALDPRYKLVLIGFCFPEIYGDKADQNIAIVRKSLYDLYDEYVVMHSQAYNEQNLHQSNTEVYSLSSVSQGKKVATGKSKYESFVRKADTIQPVKSDLDIYLEEGVYICASQAQGEEVSDSHFDALEWWKANTLKYRILSKMACDILSIPITSVASESTFSAGGRVIDPYRASLATETVEMLLYGADYVRAYHGLKKGSNMVPGPPLVLLQGSRGANSHSYSVVYAYTDGQWENWRDHAMNADKRVTIQPRVLWESHSDYLPWLLTISHFRVSPCPVEVPYTESAEDRNPASLAILDSVLGGTSGTTSTSPYELRQALVEVRRTLRGPEAAKASIAGPSLDHYWSRYTRCRRRDRT
ncbi:hypothetical protein RHSIM_Rhsim01G0135900 [Rhododendron simsii]|uniref:BED-type domain-containing protein n=1 Tax=Rhododendron simsii TaxID=118357 RepID=A0A834HF86_RHOSS|nr:hypothetical protein RHSIM_Rhsim01G0135900 [Rhododendron simsii]